LKKSSSKKNDEDKFKKLFERLKKHAITVPEHARVCGVIEEKSSGIPYTPLKNLEEAKNHPDSVIIFEGDYGGIIYATIPVSMIKCSEEELESVLEILGEGEEGNAIFYERKAIGEPVPGGLGGGLIIDGLWIHQFCLNYKNEVEKILFKLDK
jgi:hypothetical protein